MVSLAELLSQVSGVKEIPESVRKEQVIEDYSGAETHSFDATDREPYVRTMRNAGYVELPQFEDADTQHGYFCGSCEYWRELEDSPTGFWCNKFQFPDKAHGCCDGWQIHPDLKEKAFAPRHGHARIARVPLGSEKGLGRVLTRLLRGYRDKKINREKALAEARKAIDGESQRFIDHAREWASRQLGIKDAEATPEQITRTEERRSRALRDFEKVLNDSR